MAANASTQEHGITSEDHIVYLPTFETEKLPELEDKITGKGSQKDSQKEIEGVETGSTVSTKIQTLHNNKKSAKTRLTKAKNRLKATLENQPGDLLIALVQGTAVSITESTESIISSSSSVSNASIIVSVPSSSPLVV